MGQRGKILKVTRIQKAERQRQVRRYNRFRPIWAKAKADELPASTEMSVGYADVVLRGPIPD